MVDSWKRNCISNKLHEKIEVLNKQYEKGFLKYVLCNRHLHELETSYDRDLEEYSTILALHDEGNYAFQNRYLIRIAELKRQKQEWVRRLIEIRLQIFSIVCYPLLEGVFNVFRYSPDEYFSQFSDNEYNHVISHTFQWITNVTAPDIPYLKGIATTFNQVLEHYIDVKLSMEPELFIIRGQKHFHNICCSNVFHAITYYKNRTEAFYFLLCANRFRQKSIRERNHSRYQAEILVMDSHDIVTHIISFLCAHDTFSSPKNFLWM